MARYARQDYELVAKVIRETRGLLGGNEAVSTLAIVVSKFSEHFHNDNPDFDVERFILACVLDPPKAMNGKDD